MEWLHFILEQKAGSIGQIDDCKEPSTEPIDDRSDQKRAEEVDLEGRECDVDISVQIMSSLCLVTGGKESYEDKNEEVGFTFAISECICRIAPSSRARNALALRINRRRSRRFARRMLVGHLWNTNYARGCVDDRMKSVRWLCEARVWRNALYLT